MYRADIVIGGLSIGRRELQCRGGAGSREGAIDMHTSELGHKNLSVRPTFPAPVKMLRRIAGGRNAANAAQNARLGKALNSVTSFAIRAATDRRGPQRSGLYA